MKNQQRGVAIVLAMAVVALATLTATAMLVEQSTWLRQLELNADHRQAQLLIPAGLDWARAVLSDDLRSSNSDHLGEAWALKLPPMPVENGSLAGQIEDQQGKFNLNNLVLDGTVNPDQLERFRRLLALLALPPALADTLADWMGGDNQALDGTADSYYLTLTPPYLAAKRPMTNLAELALVRGFDASSRERLRPFVTALPGLTAVNVNTASAEVLAASIKGLDLDAARNLVDRRGSSYYRDLDDFSRHLPHGLTFASGGLSVSSNYFVATMQVTIGEARSQGSALLARGSADWPTIIWRTYL